MKVNAITSARLFLYSLSVSPEQCRALTDLVGKKSEDITIAVIENAADPIPNSREWLGGFREMLRSNGYQIERVDLRNWLESSTGLYEKLSVKDVIWVGGGNTYYLRWVLRKTGADEIIRELVSEGTIYSGWSAGAVVAGPTIRHFDKMGDSILDAPEYISEGLGLTEIAIVPHADHVDFGEDALVIDEMLRAEGFKTAVLNDNQTMIIDKDFARII